MNPRVKDAGFGLISIFVSNLILIASALLLDARFSSLVEVTTWVMATFGLTLTVAGWVVGGLAIRAGLIGPK